MVILCGLIDQPVSGRIDASVQKLPPYVRVPVVLDLVVRSPRQTPSNERPFVTKKAVQFDDDLILFFGEVAPLEVRPQVIDPPEAAALATAEEARGLRERPPATLAVRSYVGNELVVLLLGPCALVCVSLLAARRPSHVVDVVVVDDDDGL